MTLDKCSYRFLSGSRRGAGDRAVLPAERINPDGARQSWRVFCPARRQRRHLQPGPLASCAMRTSLKLALLLTLLLATFACRNSTPIPPLTFSPAELPDARVGELYQVTITVSGDQTPVYSISADEGEFPEWLTLHYERNQNSAEIRGIPDKAGTVEFTITASCLATSRSGQTGEIDYTLSVR